nr:transposase [Bradyrhizobium sp. SZCCHNS3002]
MPAHILFAKYGLHLPLTRQSTTYGHKGVALDVSTLADWVGATAATLTPLVQAIKAHVLAGERINADATTVPVLAKGKTRTGRVWTYVRDDHPFAGHAPPAAMFFYSPDRTGAHPEAHLAGLCRADAGGRQCRLQPAQRSLAQARPDHQGRLRRACTGASSSSLRGLRRRRLRSKPLRDRRAVCDRTRDQRSVGPRARSRA